jgi:hypothetical protein
MTASVDQRSRDRTIIANILVLLGLHQNRSNPRASRIRGRHDAGICRSGFPMFAKDIAKRRGSIHEACL